MPESLPGAYAGHMAQPASDDDLPHSAVLQRIAIPARVGRMLEQVARAQLIDSWPRSVLN